MINSKLQLQVQRPAFSFLCSLLRAKKKNEAFRQYSATATRNIFSLCDNWSTLSSSSTRLMLVPKSSQCFLSTTTTATATVSDDTMVQITRSDNVSSSSSSSSNATSSSQEQSTGCCGGGKKQKSPEQIEQEEIVAIQMYIREMHREAKYEEALEASEALILKCEKTFGVNHPATASSYNNAAVMHKMLGNYNDARSRYHDALRVYKHVVGKDHSSYASALNNLGNLARAQVQYDETLTAVERLGLLQSSVDYIQEALKIRVAELGEDHPHTVTSQSNLGGALAAQVLYRTTTNDNATKITQQQRDMAEHHLRSALKLAVQNQNKMIIATTKMSSSNNTNINNKDTKEEESLVVITSLSAAAAAQNLAVFLKVVADQQRAATNNGTAMELYLEAKWLYEQALAVRKEKIPAHHHHDTIATMSSLAELRAAIGDEEGATELRQEILNSIELLSSHEEGKQV